MFDNVSNLRKMNVTDFEGEVVAVKLRERVTFEGRDAVFCDIFVLSGAHRGTFVPRTFLFKGAMAATTKNRIGEVVVGIPTRRRNAGPFSFQWQLDEEPFTEQDRLHAEDLWNSRIEVSA